MWCLLAASIFEFTGICTALVGVIGREVAVVVDAEFGGLRPGEAARLSGSLRLVIFSVEYPDCEVLVEVGWREMSFVVDGASLRCRKASRDLFDGGVGNGDGEGERGSWDWRE